MRVYLAGKMDSDWRHAFIPPSKRFDFESHDGEDFYDCSSENGDAIDIDDYAHQMSRWPIGIQAVLDRFDYTGPYRADNNAGHGWIGWYAGDKGEKPSTFHHAAGEGSYKDHVPSMCLWSIHESDVVFAWIEGGDAYGTIAEIGIARAMGKELWVAFSSHMDDRLYADLWFVRSVANGSRRTEDPLAAWESLYSERITEILKALPYSEYLKSEHWQALRVQALERADHRCQLCNSHEWLHVHHRTYERLGEESLGDVTVLCRSCHERFHQVVDGKATRMPEVRDKTPILRKQNPTLRTIKVPEYQHERIGMSALRDVGNEDS